MTNNLENRGIIGIFGDASAGDYQNAMSGTPFVQAPATNPDSRDISDMAVQV